MKRNVFILLIVLLLSTRMINAQWNNSGDNITSGNLILKNTILAPLAGNIIHFTSYDTNYDGPRIRSSLQCAGCPNGTTSDLILSSYSNGYKDELILSNGNIGMNANITLRNWSNISNAGCMINFTSYGTDHVGPQIRSSLKLASGTNSKSDLILSSYWEGYKNEIILSNGNVGIGVAPSNVKLDVAGIIRANEVKVCLNQGCDFVFDKSYKLLSIQELDNFIKLNNHLPDIAPASMMENEGINLSEMNAKLLQKIEEQSLYIIELNKRLTELEKLIKK
jgi:hypothetical protein